MNLKQILLVVLLPLISLALKGQETKPETGTGILRAGFAKIDITPAIPVRLYGYADRKGYSDGVHDPLSARIVAFGNNGKKIVLVSCDLGSFGNEVFSAIQKSILERYGLKESELFLSTIHSHSSPVLTLRPSDDANNITYTKTLQEKLLTAVGEAIGNMKPVMTGMGRGSSPIGANRREMDQEGKVIIGRNPYGPADKEVLVMKISSQDGKDMGALFDYATHSTALGWLNMKVSGDVLGLSAQFTEKILGKETVTPVFAGASGNIDPWYRVLPEFNNEPGWIPEPVLLATLLGEEVIHVYRGINQMQPGGRIFTSFTRLDCPPKNAPEDDEIAQNPASVPVNITVARIGDDIAFIGFNVEMLTEIGMKIKEASPFKYTFVITHCNGSSGYLPPAELYKEGGYEVTTSHFGIKASGMVIDKALEMLYDIKRQ